MKSVLILLAIFFIVLALKKALESKKARGAGEASVHRDTVRHGRGDSEEMVLDTVCGTYVPISSALKSSEGGRSLFFCSEECRAKFMAGHA
ncbi:MAG: YHS domain-containing protein [Deltaproteobacteria bacterium]|nr:YHS domain-containing protein [Deltaproteobacteria bacterium]MBZ0221216.1 hypothetical protein [Deltaproteobacteria bacterium]